MFKKARPLERQGAQVLYSSLSHLQSSYRITSNFKSKHSKNQIYQIQDPEHVKNVSLVQAVI